MHGNELPDEGACEGYKVVRAAKENVEVEFGVSAV